MLCRLCNDTVLWTDLATTCDLCRQWFHSICLENTDNFFQIPLTREYWAFLAKKRYEFKCVYCDASSDPLPVQNFRYNPFVFTPAKLKALGATSPRFVEYLKVFSLKLLTSNFKHFYFQTGEAKRAIIKAKSARQKGNKPKPEPSQNSPKPGSSSGAAGDSSSSKRSKHWLSPKGSEREAAGDQKKNTGGDSE